MVKKVTRLSKQPPLISPDSVLVAEFHPMKPIVGKEKKKAEEEDTANRTTEQRSSAVAIAVRAVETVPGQPILTGIRRVAALKHATIEQYGPPPKERRY